MQIDNLDQFLKEFSPPKEREWSKEIEFHKFKLIKSFALHSKLTKVHQHLFEQIKIAQASAELLILEDGSFNTSLVEPVIKELHLPFTPLNRQRHRAISHLRWLKDSEQGVIRNIHEEEVNEIPLRLSFAPEYLDSYLSGYIDGSLYDDKDPLQIKSVTMLWDIPELERAAISIGIKDLSLAFGRMMITFGYDEKFYEPIKFDFKKMIDFLILHAKNRKEGSYSRKKLKKLAILNCESNFRHPLLKIWNSTFSSLPESGNSGEYKKKLMNTLKKSLEKLFERQLERDKESWKKISTSFYEFLSKALYYRYDPSFFKQELAKDENACRGAFILYCYPIFLLNPHLHRIDSPPAFQNLLKSLLDS